MSSTSPAATLDLIRTTHGREPYERPRQVLVTLADPVRLADQSPTVERSGR